MIADVSHLRCWTEALTIPRFNDAISTEEECLNSLPAPCHKMAIALLPYTSQDKFPHNFLTPAHIRSIALVAEHMLSREDVTCGNYFIQRKRLGMSIKPIFPAGKVTILLLPKKGPRAAGQGLNKWPRPALACSLVEGAWYVQRLWNLTSLKMYYGNYDPIFFEARTNEQKIQKAIPARLSPTVIEDFTVLPYNNKRSCFYTYYPCLIDCFEYKGFLSDRNRIQQLALSAAKKVALLHENGFAWCDLKPDNMLVGDDNQVLLCDLDRTTESKSCEIWKNSGTKAYAPPEVLLGNLADNKKADIFAFGCMLYEMIVDQQVPWLRDNAKRKLDYQTLDSYRAFASDAKENLERSRITSIQKLMFWLAQACLHPDFSDRPDMQTICTYLEGNYPAQDDLAIEDIQPYLDIEVPRSYCVIN